MMKTPLIIKVQFTICCLIFGIPGILLLILGMNIHQPIVIIFGLFMSACGGIPFYIVLRKRILKKQMLQKGTLVMTKVVAVNLAYYNLFGWRPYIITTQWLDPITNLIYHFKSPAFNHDPSAMINEEMQIPVYIDRQNPKYRYYMNVAKVPALFIKGEESL